ncbi:hypothetical protein [Aequorivita echinoideorum]|uniref:Universal stress protein family protein n=1 Tax=Aequorivita echinoideorum TaxID=1549647 RepID=A0ABS5S0S1_9FLAO|nr:hypothetical protein [Aequorivita echinoideorum]MBT0606816.1 hypothetical protein [Aequorivita echinoideorum]
METKKILIPTDFSVKSLNLVKQAIETSREEKVDIVLLQGAYLPSSITEMLFFSKRKLVKSFQSEEFNEACKMLKNKYDSRINSFCVDVITSKNNAYFQEYLLANGIDEIVVPNEDSLNFKGKNSFSPLPLFTKCKVKLNHLECSSVYEKATTVREQISDLFFSRT